MSGDMEALASSLNNYILDIKKLDTYDFKAPKRGRIKELIVSEKYRKGGYGTILLEAMEKYLKRI